MLLTCMQDLAAPSRPRLLNLPGGYFCRDPTYKEGLIHPAGSLSACLDVVDASCQTVAKSDPGIVIALDS